ncbi:hypothetical protein RT21_18030 [Pseudomonas sp. 10B238]|nr:hypothetical protein RT21_18030 [Pseudomonas sp. 10B238]MAL35421.1 hypothetical protein [Pseudomonas sp.]HBM08453.1 hypothetical protein [Pseudomonas sp.]
MWLAISCMNDRPCNKSWACWPRASLVLARLIGLVRGEASLQLGLSIDIPVLFKEGVLTQIKRAYESSVCHANAVSPVYRVGGCRFTGNGDGLRTDDVRHVTFSFHTVEIS